MSSIKCLERALDILDLMYKNGGKMTLTEISKELDLYKSTVHRTLITLLEKDFIQKDEYTSYYTLGSRVFMLGMVAAKSVPIGKIARPHLEFLSEKYQEYVELSVLDSGIKGDLSNNSENEFVVVFQQYMNETYSKTLVTANQCESSEEFLPAVYLIFVAYSIKLDKDELMRHLYKINSRSMRKKWSYEELVEECKEIRKRGYSYLESDIKTGYVCVGTPIFNDKNGLVAVLSMRGSKAKFNKISIDSVIQEVMNTGNLISEQYKRVL